MSAPPKLAMWLLDRLGTAAQNPALAGDLLEEFSGGRSRGWYWRQTLHAIAAGVRCNARTHRNHVWAIVAGWAIQACVAAVIYRFRLGPQPHGVLWRIGACLLLLLAALVWGMLSGILSGLANVFLDGSLSATWPGRLSIAGNAFFVNLLVYYLCVLLAGFSLPCLLFGELYWLLSDLRGPLFDKHNNPVC